MIKIGLHADSVRPYCRGIVNAIDVAAKYELDHVEFMLIGGQWYFSPDMEPGIALSHNPILLRKMMEAKNLRISQLGVSIGMEDFHGAIYGVSFTQQAIRFANDCGCRKVTAPDNPTNPTTNPLLMPEPGLSSSEILKQTIRNFEACIKWAEDFKVIITLEGCGPVFIDSEFLLKVLKHFESEYIRVLADTGNLFMLGKDPLEDFKILRKYIAHVHIKDVSHAALNEVQGGEESRRVYAGGDIAVGQGANADNIKRCISYLMETGWDGDVSICCPGTDDNIQKSTKFLKSIIQ